MMELVNFIFHRMKISIFRHKLAFKQGGTFLKSFSISVFGTISFDKVSIDILDTF